MTNLIEARGNRDDIVKAAMDAGIPSEEIAQLCLNVLCEHSELLPDGEFVEYEDQTEKQGEGASELIVGGGRYYIRVSRQVFMFSLIFAEEIALHIAGVNVEYTLAAIVGTAFAGALNNRASDDKFKMVFKIDEYQGEKCILLEYAKSRIPLDAKEIKRRIGKTCDKGYDCTYLKKGKCTCKKDDIEKISETLSGKGMLEPNGAGYKYVLI